MTTTLKPFRFAASKCIEEISVVNGPLQTCKLLHEVARNTAQAQEAEDVRQGFMQLAALLQNIIETVDKAGQAAPSTRVEIEIKGEKYIKTESQTHEKEEQEEEEEEKPATPDLKKILKEMNGFATKAIETLEEVEKMIKAGFKGEREEGWKWNYLRKAENIGGLLVGMSERLEKHEEGGME
jgi:tRNA U34 5-carboxymethylaminomethyl modifying enzyme MnmG/GidA